MSNIFRKNIPAEFTDEDRWRIGSVSLSRKTFIILMIGFGCTYGLFRLLGFIGLQMLGVWIGVILTLIVTILCGIKIPQDEYMRGAGLTMMTLLLRLLIRKKKKVVYIRGYGNDIKKK